MTAQYRILIAGKSGQIARALRARKHPVFALYAHGREEMDITSEADIRSTFQTARPNLVINTAAYTDVDQAEQVSDLAYAVNAEGARNLARISADAGVPIIHLSTDFVFDGIKSAPYVESDPTAPLGVYGQSKLEGERAVAALNPNHLIIRTAWIFSPYGRNFVSTMLDLAKTRNELGVVSDQIGSPTSADDIAEGLLALAETVLAKPDTLHAGLYHMTGRGQASRAELAAFALQVSAELGGPAADITPISSAQYPTAAKRPANSCLDCSKLEQTYSIRLKAWRDTVRTVVGRLIN